MNVRQSRLYHANNRCECCGVDNYSIGHYNGGKWVEDSLALTWKGSLRVRNRLAAKDQQPKETPAVVFQRPRQYIVKRLNVFQENGTVQMLCQKCHRAKIRKDLNQKRNEKRHIGQIKIDF